MQSSIWNYGYGCHVCLKKKNEKAKKKRKVKNKKKVKGGLKAVTPTLWQLLSKYQPGYTNIFSKASSFL